MESEVKSMNLSEWVMLTILSILWGGSFFFVGVAVKALPPLTIVSLRVTLASLTLLAVVHFSGLRLPMRREVWIAFLGMSLLNNVIPFSLIVWGQTHIASGLASILNATTPLFTVIAAHVWTRDEKMNPMKVFGVAIGLIPSCLYSLLSSSCNRWSNQRTSGNITHTCKRYSTWDRLSR